MPTNVVLYVTLYYGMIYYEGILTDGIGMYVRHFYVGDL